MADHWILLIDPFKNLLNAYHMILEEEHYGVETVLNITEAYKLFQKRKYSILITEYIPPFDITEEMIQWMKKNSPETYILMVTNAFVDEKTYEKLFTIGVDDFILKPYSPNKILVHLRKGLKQREILLKMQELERLTLLEPIPGETRGFIFNTRFFRACLRQEIKKSKRHHHPFSLLLFQMPVKEQTGDRFDRFYMELVKIIRGDTREEDIVGRNNGEIGIILPETDQIGCQALIQRLLNLISTHPQFVSDEMMASFLQGLSFQSFTYPDLFRIPESLKMVLEDIEDPLPLSH